MPILLLATIRDQGVRILAIAFNSLSTIAFSASIALPGMLRKSVVVLRSYVLIWVVRILVEVDLLDYFYILS